jgi:signal transduction histidine kinase
MKMTIVEAPPKASILIESMRDIGYTLETALADVIDNSIASGATIIDIHVDTISPQMRIAVIDNGCGMTKAQLLDAMRLGSRHPREARQSTDLGRFGLGLKTASLSQCRRLTVAARKDGQTSVATWDLDHVQRHDSWSLIMSAPATRSR